MIAQEFREVFPDHVKSSGETLPDGDEILQVDPFPLTIYSAAAVQELNEIVKKQRAQNNDLQARLSALEDSVRKMTSSACGNVARVNVCASPAHNDSEPGR